MSITTFRDLEAAPGEGQNFGISPLPEAKPQPPSVPGQWQWNRDYSLAVGDPKGDGIEFRNLRMKFQVRHFDGQTPNHADITIYNPAPRTAKLVYEEFTKLVLKCGYFGLSGASTLGQIFAGEIKQVRIGRENPTDTYLNILAANGDLAHNGSTINTTMAAGYTMADLHDSIQDAFAPFGIMGSEQSKDWMPKDQSPRGRAVFGMTRDRARETADSMDATWSLQNDQFNMHQIEFPSTDHFDVPFINARTGMVGMPQVTIRGIVVQCLINPQIKADGYIKLNNADIQDMKLEGPQLMTPTSQETQQQTGSQYYQWAPRVSLPGVIPPKAEDGIYKVAFLDHEGDTRGNTWYTTIICFSPAGGVPQGLISGYVPAQGA